MNDAPISEEDEGPDHKKDRRDLQEQEEKAQEQPDRFVEEV